MGRVAAVLRESNPFADFVRAFAPIASQAIDKRNETEAWNKFSDTFVPQQPMDAQQVQSPVQPLQGQASLTTQPSMPVEQPQTSTEQVNMPSKDPYKQLEYQTGKEFATKLKALSALNPNERQFAMRQLYQEREQLLSNARYDKFSQDMEGIMAEYNPADPVASHKAKAKAIALGRRLKIDTGDVLKLFEQDKPIAVAAGTTLINPRTMQPMYTAPEAPLTAYQRARLENTKPTGQLTEYQRYQIEKDKGKSDVIIPTPFGPMKNTDLLAKIEQFRPKETTGIDPITGEKKIIKDGNPELYNQLTGALKDWQNKQNPANSNQSTAAQSDLQMPLILEGISAIGEDAMRKKIAAKYGDKVAEEWIVRSRNWSR